LKYKNEKWKEGKRRTKRKERREGKCLGDWLKLENEWED
jgi:hypothetical protein